MAQQHGFIQLRGGQGPPEQQQGLPGNVGGHQGSQDRFAPTHLPPPPIGQVPRAHNQAWGPMSPRSPSFGQIEMHRTLSARGQMMRVPRGQGELSHTSPHRRPHFNGPQADFPKRQRVEVHDNRSRCFTEPDARDRLSSYVLVTMTKTDVSNEEDDEGNPLQPTWDRATLKTDEISKQEATRKVRSLDKETYRAVDKKQDLSLALQGQLDYAQRSLEESEVDPRYHHVLAQFDFRYGKVDDPPALLYVDGGGHKKSKHRSRSKDRKRDKSKGKGKHRSKYYEEPHRSKEKRRKEIATVTAYFRRAPRPEINALEMWRDQEEYGDFPEMALGLTSTHMAAISWDFKILATGTTIRSSRFRLIHIMGTCLRATQPGVIHLRGIRLRSNNPMLPSCKTICLGDIRLRDNHPMLSHLRANSHILIRLRPRAIGLRAIHLRSNNRRGNSLRGNILVANSLRGNSLKPIYLKPIYLKPIYPRANILRVNILRVNSLRVNSLRGNNLRVIHLKAISLKPIYLKPIYPRANILRVNSLRGNNLRGNSLRGNSLRAIHLKAIRLRNNLGGNSLRSNSLRAIRLRNNLGGNSLRSNSLRAVHPPRGLRTQSLTRGQIPQDVGTTVFPHQARIT
ncbi:hypothetical protein ACO1O0_008262 [Amphichorda felina]